MKKIIFFLIIVASIFINTSINVQAASANFYEAEYIDGIWMNKVSPGKTIYYQKARFFRQTGTNAFAYCIQPFVMFEEGSTYESTITPANLSTEQIERIKEIAHFGYGYYNHNSNKWYAITQFMIWQTADPSGDYYFTDSLNGNRITKFTEEMNEINNLISTYHQNPSMSGNTYKIVENQELILTDNNNVLTQYITVSPYAKIQGNNLVINKLPEGNYDIILERQDNLYNNPILFYQSSTSQNLVETGNLNTKKLSLRIEVQKTRLELTKTDADTNTTVPSGEAKLEGAIYQLYDQDMKEITTLTINKDCKASIENLVYGKYYLKEIKAGTGYQLDNNTYEININQEKPIIELTLKNEVIKKKIEINKTYGTENNFQAEANISFNIYDKDHNLITTITTNELGYASIDLPYGTYKVEQLTSTPGYEKIESFDIIVSDTNPLTYNLKDYKIKVPNTKTTTKNIIELIIGFFINLLC